MPKWDSLEASEFFAAVSGLCSSLGWAAYPLSDISELWCCDIQV